MSTDTPPQQGKRSISELFKTVWGWVGAVPAILEALDAWLGFLPIAPALKPEVYIFSTVGVAFGLGSQVARYFGISTSSEAFAKMLARSRNSILTAAAFGVIYYLLKETSQSWIPENLFGRTLILALMILLVSCVFTFVTITFTILGMRMYLLRAGRPPSEPLRSPPSP